MSKNQVVDMFNEERRWLENQPDMVPWEEGCHGLTERLRQWLQTYSEPICEAVINDDHEAWSEYMGRLWQCLEYHWRQAAELDGGIESEAVAQRIQSGRGYQKGGRLGGDPLRDVVLAMAMTQRDGNAPRVFESDYYGLSRGLAGKLNRRLADDPDQWWNDLLDHLAGYTTPPGRLHRFFGRCALQNWLPPVLWNFLRRWMQREQKLKNASDVEQMAKVHLSTDDGVETAESLRCFIELVRRSLDALSSEERLLLALVYLDELKQKDVAAVLGIHPGNVTRRLQKVIERFRVHIERFAVGYLDNVSYQGVLEELTEDPKAFARALHDALAEKQEDQS